MSFLETFLRNLLMGEHNELKNRYMHTRIRMRYMSFVITIPGELQGASGYSGKTMMKLPEWHRLEELLPWNMVRASEERSFMKV